MSSQNFNHKIQLSPISATQSASNSTNQTPIKKKRKEEKISQSFSLSDKEEYEKEENLEKDCEKVFHPFEEKDKFQDVDPIFVKTLCNSLEEIDQKKNKSNSRVYCVKNWGYFLSESFLEEDEEEENQEKEEKEEEKDNQEKEGKEEGEIFDSSADQYPLTQNTFKKTKIEINKEKDENFQEKQSIFNFLEKFDSEFGMQWNNEKKNKLVEKVFETFLN